MSVNSGKMVGSTEEKTPLVVSKLYSPPRDVCAQGVVGLVLVLYMFSYTSSGPLISQFIVKKLTELPENSIYVTNNTMTNHTGSCNNQTSLPNVEIQKQASDLNFKLSVATGVFAIMVNLVLGPLSDLMGRKILFVFPVIGLALKSFVVCLVIQLDLDLGYLYVAFGLDGICGSLYSLLMAAFSYTADLTMADKQRTFAIACVEGCLGLSAGTGLLLSGHLIKDAGFFYAALLIAAVVVIDLIIVVIFLPETKTKFVKKGKSTCWYAKDVVNLYFLEGSLRKRCLLYLVMCIFLLSIIAKLSQVPFETIYQVGEPFCWDSVTIGYYQSLGILGQLVCSLIALKLFQPIFGDEIICILSTMSCAGGLLFEGLVTTSLQYYFVPIVGSIGTISTPTMRSIMSKMISPDKQGALFAGVAFVETICHATSVSLYNLVYHTTVNYYAGTVWLVMSGISGINICLITLFIWASKYKRVKYTNVESRFNSETSSSNSEASSSNSEAICSYSKKSHRSYSEF